METDADVGVLKRAEGLRRADDGDTPPAAPQPAALVRVRGRDRRQHHGSHGRDDRQRRRPVDPGRARRQRVHPAMAACRLHAGVRRVLDHRRPSGRHVRSPAAVSDRLRRLHADVRSLLGGPFDGGADRLPSAAGFVRGADDPPGVRDDQGGLRREGDHQGVRRLRAGNGPLDPGRPDPGRCAGGGQPVGDRMAAGVLDQRADRHRGVRRGYPGATADRRPSRDPPRHRRDGADRRRSDRDHLPADPGPHRWVAGLDLCLARRSERCCSACSCCGSAAFTAIR